MFSNKAEKQKAPRQGATQRVVPSLIAANMNIVGNIASDGEVQIDGSLEGDVSCEKLLLGESARVHGEITAKEVVVRGQVKGLIKGGSVELAKTARVIGDITHDSLAIESGAHLEGHCRRNDSTGEVLDSTQAAKLANNRSDSTATRPAAPRQATAKAS